VDEDAAAAAERYGRAFPESFGGVFVDQRAGGVLVATFTKDTDRHERAMATLIPDQPPDVRQVEWSLAELESFRMQVQADRAWFASIGAELSKADVDILENAVRVVFRGPNQDMASLVEEHLGSWTTASWQGPLPWNGPVGDLVLSLVDDSGRPVPQVWCDLVSADPRVQVAEGPPVGSDAAGRCTFDDYPAVAYTVALRVFTGTGYQFAKEVQATLVPTGTVIEVVVPTH
jgi:hypothetical protein